MFGQIQDYQKKKNKVIINYEQHSGEVEFISPSIVNFFAPISNQRRFSRAVEEIKGDNISFEVTEDVGIILKTEQLKVVIHDQFKVDIYNKDDKIISKDYRGERKPFIRRGKGDIIAEEGHQIIKGNIKNRIEVLKEMTGEEYFYGLGEQTGPLNKKGYRYQMWNTDDPSPHVESFESLYKSIPFVIILKDGLAYGLFFDNTYRSYFDLGKESSQYLYYGVDNGNLNYYFIYGPSIKEVVEKYTYLTGRTPLPQLWTLGYHQSRYSYDSENRVREVADKLREKDIPCDAIYLDIDYMDGYRVFTWDQEKFPNFEKLISDLKKQGFKVVTIVDPGIKKDNGYLVYDEGLSNGYFARDKDGIPYVNRVWPGESLYPDFSSEEVRKWWADKQNTLLETGVAGIWNDMNEPASFDGPLPADLQFENEGHQTDHQEIHNVYGHLMVRASAEGIKKYTGKRPFVITRAAYAGTQKYSTVWTGDNQSFWEHLRMSLPMLMNLGLSGMAFCGADLGGFSFDCSGELLSRWVQVGAFTPLFRNHSAAYTRDQEPWCFDLETERIYRKYVKLRYRLIPYLYDLFWQEQKIGLPIIRPLVLHYQDDENTYELNDQFLVGENILVAPVVQQGQLARAVYLPSGKWVDYWTKEIIEGGRYILKKTPLDTCPIFIKEGSLIPNYKVGAYLDNKMNQELILDLYPGDFNYLHYQDDGESFNYQKGEYNLYQFAIACKQDLTISIKKIHYKYNGYKKFTFMINNYQAEEVLVDGQSHFFQNDEDRFVLVVGPDAKEIKISGTGG
ncbi:glycoside hydrolase family 31 protein [Halocella sp. SP3-1]|uniref:glycoside hydrolase family 31 protein n=1 Tax=Halocella sp. SP3-1 TaxID=2382161 RepID=UPI000F75950F|nr:glycoside hydrolase family 31 protein [Halocella sp. SP3-1]AZO96419.1 DUF4968 domain-containing protein [Halocella sp. SP3-1]